MVIRIFREGIPMKHKETFLKTVSKLAIPVALQSILQSSFSIVDQIMIGQLGTVKVAGVGLVGKFISIYSVLISAIGTVAGIMISQYVGQKNKKEINRSFKLNLVISLILAVLFIVPCIIFSQNIMGLYTEDYSTMKAAAQYLLIVTYTFIPMAGTTILSTLFRCMDKAALPLYASIVSALLNTGLNYIFIFGNFGIKPMGAIGAAIATVISQVANLLIMIVMFMKYRSQVKVSADDSDGENGFKWKQYLAMLMPILVCELLWSLGENVYAGIYGHISTDASAAMTLTNPIQGLLIGALCGLSQAAGIIIGKLLGNKDLDEAYTASKKLIKYGVVGSVILSVVVLIIRPFYVEIYDVDQSVKILTQQILVAYAAVAPFKVLNMILGGGIIRSGGKTKYVMAIDMIGTWLFGVPLGYLTAFVFHMSIPYVYFILSLEECIRFGISLVVFKRKGWMQSLK